MKIRFLSSRLIQPDYRTRLVGLLRLLLVVSLMSAPPQLLASAHDTLPAITLLLLGAEDENEPSGPVTATLRSLTRLHGVSPETIYFSADQSNDIADTSLQHRYGRLAYYFDFDDPDSGVYATTGASKNHQVGGSPRAIHTFVCTPESSRYQDGICTYQVGVRVQNQIGEFDDDFLTVTIAAAEHHYGAPDTICVSTSGNFAGCDGIQMNQTPNVGAFSGRRVRFRRGESFTSACIGYQVSNLFLVSFGDVLNRQFFPFGSSHQYLIQVFLKKHQILLKNLILFAGFHN